MNYPRITLPGGLAVAVLLTGCPDSSGKPGGKDWTRWTCDSRVMIERRYINDSKNIVDLRLKDEGDVVHHLEQEPVAVGASYSDGRLGFHLESDEGLVYWVETGDLTGHGCKARQVAPVRVRRRDRSS